MTNTKKKNKVIEGIKKTIGATVLGIKYICMGVGYIFTLAFISVAIDKWRHPEKYEEKGE